MKKISKIRKNKDKYEVILSGGESLSFYEQTIINYNLLKPRSIDDNLLKEIIEYNKVLEIYYEAIKFISIKMRSKKEIYLKFKNCNKTLLDKAIVLLEEKGYINEENYIEAYINDAINLTKKGPLKIKRELKSLGLSDSLINEKIDSINKDIWAKRISIIIMKKKNNKYSDYIFKEKLRVYLINLGYADYINDEIFLDLDSNEKNIIMKEYTKQYNKLSNKYNGKELESKIKYNLYKKGYNKELINEILINTRLNM